MQHAIEKLRTIYSTWERGLYATGAIFMFLLFSWACGFMMVGLLVLLPVSEFSSCDIPHAVYLAIGALVGLYYFGCGLKPLVECLQDYVKTDPNLP